MNIRIRNFKADDFEDVLCIESESFTEHNPFAYIHFYEMHGNMFLVAEYLGSIVGFVVGYRMNEREGRVFSLAVREEFQGKGIGTMLLDALFKEFYSNLLKYATLEVRTNNIKAKGLYLKMGFVPCWIEKGYYSDGEDGIIMKMKLSSYKFQELDILAEKIERMSQKSTEDFNG
ncbi:ribosomal protein S18-alanine N-acetyltransferase [Methanomethylovorans sp.]|uniref:ribosomal protein S18-alanine N-acetyltransferase n=1 Tax=Methanomethylovorans sp. TaxID=2758717 RepID=UPI000B1F5B7F|nr:ribosomal protein S18-alanine N-acetyltransferase [Methanomethylovorans sp.]